MVYVWTCPTVIFLAIFKQKPSKNSGFTVRLIDKYTNPAKGICDFCSHWTLFCMYTLYFDVTIIQGSKDKQIFIVN